MGNESETVVQPKIVGARSPPRNTKRITAQTRQTRPGSHAGLCFGVREVGGWFGGLFVGERPLLGSRDGAR
eukprot:2153504-Amphidinium_carterae.1